VNIAQNNKIFPEMELGAVTVAMICRLRYAIIALPTPQSRTGSLGLVQDIGALKVKNVLGDQLE
jgi:hypothetical protein